MLPLRPRRTFQSPSGVLGVCRIPGDNVFHNTDTMFQSPSGVLGVCRAITAVVALRSETGQFQSPSGVLGVCRGHEWNPIATGSLGFQSPSGVLGVCRHLSSPIGLRGVRGVSVPFRGFRGLQGRSPATVRGTPGVFQSPSGVLGVCRAGKYPEVLHEGKLGFSPLPGF